MLTIHLPIRQLVEFLLRTGSIDSRFTGFDRANEGARIHRRLQKAAGEGYAAEVFLTAEREMDGIAFALEGRADGIFTDPQKPMKVAPGIYPINGAGPDDPCALTVDFALTYFLVSGELERSKIPVNLLITDASGMSVLTAWAAGKFSSTSVKKFFDEFDIASKINNRTLIIPGKVAVMKGENSELIEMFNAGLANIRESGEYDEIVAKYLEA